CVRAIAAVVLERHALDRQTPERPPLRQHELPQRARTVGVRIPAAEAHDGDRRHDEIRSAIVGTGAAASATRWRTRAMTSGATPNAIDVMTSAKKRSNTMCSETSTPYVAATSPP